MDRTGYTGKVRRRDYALACRYVGPEWLRGRWWPEPDVVFDVKITNTEADCGKKLGEGGLTQAGMTDALEAIWPLSLGAVPTDFCPCTDVGATGSSDCYADIDRSKESLSYEAPTKTVTPSPSASTGRHSQRERCEDARSITRVQSGSTPRTTAKSSGRSSRYSPCSI